MHTTKLRLKHTVLLLSEASNERNWIATNAHYITTKTVVKYSSMTWLYHYFWLTSAYSDHSIWDTKDAPINSRSSCGVEWRRIYLEHDENLLSSSNKGNSPTYNTSFQVSTFLPSFIPFTTDPSPYYMTTHQGHWSGVVELKVWQLAHLQEVEPLGKS